MIDRRFEAIENDENQELSKMLACAEQHLTCVEFGRKLLYMASQGRADQSFLLARAEVSYGLQSQCYSVIAGEHIRKRTQQRTWIQPGMVVEVTVGWLNSLLGPEIVEHQAEWDSTEKCMAPKSGDWCATAIVDEKHGFTLVLEAGETYVHIVTLVGQNPQFPGQAWHPRIRRRPVRGLCRRPQPQQAFPPHEKRALTGSFFHAYISALPSFISTDMS